MCTSGVCLCVHGSVYMYAYKVCVCVCTHSRSHALELFQCDAVVHAADIFSLILKFRHSDLERDKPDY